MRLAVKLLLAVMVIAMLLPFTLLKDDSGNPLLEFSSLKWSEWSWPDWSKATKFLSSTASSSNQGAESTDTIFQWVDADGNKQFSNSEPPEGIDFTVKIYDPNLNVIQSVKTKTDATNKAEVIAEETQEKELKTSEDPGSPYSADGIKKLFEDTHNIEKLLNQRFEQQKSVIDQ